MQIKDLIYESLTTVLTRMKTRYRKLTLPTTYSKIWTHVTFDKEGTKTYAMRLKEEFCTAANAAKQSQQLILSTSLSKDGKILLIPGKEHNLTDPTQISFYHLQSWIWQHILSRIT